jgi:hypothetical protein
MARRKPMARPCCFLDGGARSPNAPNECVPFPRHAHNEPHAPCASTLCTRGQHSPTGRPTVRCGTPPRSPPRTAATASTHHAPNTAMTLPPHPSVPPLLSRLTCAHSCADMDTALAPLAPPIATGVLLVYSLLCQALARPMLAASRAAWGAQPPPAAPRHALAGSAARTGLNAAARRASCPACCRCARWWPRAPHWTTARCRWTRAPRRAHFASWGPCGWASPRRAPPPPTPAARHHTAHGTRTTTLTHHHGL